MKIKGIFRQATALMLAVLLCAVSAQAKLTDATVQSYEQQLADLAVRQEEALAKLDAVRDDYSDVMQTKAYYDEVVALSIKKKDLAQAQFDAITVQIAEKEAAIAKAEEDIAKQEAAFSDRMVTMYEEGEASFLGLLLGADNLVDFLSRVDMVTTIQAYDRQVISSLEAAKEELAENVADLEHSLALQEEAQKVLEADILAAQQIADESLAYMESLKTNEAALLKQYYANREAEEALDAQLSAYLAELQAKQNSAYVGGSMGWPLPVDVHYRVSSEYGERILWGVPDFHYGIDLACACNTPIYAANAGTVVTSTVHGSYGEYVVIDHGGGQATCMPI